MAENYLSRERIKKGVSRKACLPIFVNCVILNIVLKQKHWTARKFCSINKKLSMHSRKKNLFKETYGTVSFEVKKISKTRNFITKMCRKITHHRPCSQYHLCYLAWQHSIRWAYRRVQLTMQDLQEGRCRWVCCHQSRIRPVWLALVGPYWM